jgi:hypothetical protein
MRDTLIIGLLLAMPAALILASAALALVADRLHRRPQELNGRLQRPDMTPEGMDRPTTARPGRQAAILR